MPYCPTCRGEFRDGFTRCETCDEWLVDVLGEAPPKMDEASMAEYLSTRELAIISSGPLDRLKMLKSLLCDNGIANIILSPDAGCGCSGGGCAPSLELAIAVDDIEAAAAVLKTEFHAMVGSEGEDAIATTERTVDFNADEVFCPACNTKMAPGCEECSECGLYVGVPAEFLEQE